MVVGAVSFLFGLLILLALFQISGRGRIRLFDINVALGSAIVLLLLGGFLVYQAASALGGTTSRPLRTRNLLPLLLVFPVLVAAGQYQVNHPDRLPWLFPLVNIGIVAIPSIVVAMTVARRYMAFNTYALPVSWREWTSGIVYGAIGATTPAAIINTIYIGISVAAVLAIWGPGGEVTRENLQYQFQSVPRGVGIALDLSVFSLVAPINEEFWKGMLVAFFFFRRGGLGRCFLWGVIAGAGFNVLETFNNSLSVLSPGLIRESTFTSQWWFFASVRVGTGVIHSAATGLSAVGFYGIFRRRKRFAACLPLGMSIHGTWNGLNFLIDGDAMISGAGPDETWLDWVGVAGLALLFCVCVALLWELPRRLRDSAPAPIYSLLGMLPAAPGTVTQMPSIAAVGGLPPPPSPRSLRL